MYRVWFLTLSTVFILVGVIVRVHGVDDPILGFHPTRQYRSAIIARSCYYDHLDGVSPERLHVAHANRDMQPAGEPPLLEWAACAAYRLAGHESLSVPRTVSAVVWVLGAIPLALVALRGASAGATLISIAIYLFAPYGILASRAF